MTPIFVFFFVQFVFPHKNVFNQSKRWGDNGQTIGDIAYGSRLDKIDNSK